MKKPGKLYSLLRKRLIMVGILAVGILVMAVVIAGLYGNNFSYTPKASGSRPDMCIQMTVNGVRDIDRLGSESRITITNKLKTPAITAYLAVNNWDNIDANGAPKALCVKSGGDSTYQGTCPTGTYQLAFVINQPQGDMALIKQINYQQLFVQDLNNSNKIPHQVQIGGYYFDKDGNMSQGDLNCASKLTSLLPAACMDNPGGRGVFAGCSEDRQCYGGKSSVCAQGISWSCKDDDYCVFAAATTGGGGGEETGGGGIGVGMGAGSGGTGGTRETGSGGSGGESGGSVKPLRYPRCESGRGCMDVGYLLDGANVCYTDESGNINYPKKCCPDNKLPQRRPGGRDAFYCTDDPNPPSEELKKPRCDDSDKCESVESHMIGAYKCYTKYASSVNYLKLCCKSPSKPLVIAGIYMCF